MELEWIIQDGTRILYVDFRGAEKEDAYISLLFQVLQKSRESQGRFLVLYNFQDVIFPPGVLEAIATFAKSIEINPAKAAFVGMNNFNENILRRIDKFLSEKTKRKLFISEDEAKAWLIL
jgi:hypothetical protein